MVDRLENAAEGEYECPLRVATVSVSHRRFYLLPLGKHGAAAHKAGEEVSGEVGDECARRVDYYAPLIYLKDDGHPHARGLPRYIVR